MDFSLKALLGRIGLLRGDHLDEAEAARFASVRVAHDVALLDIAVFLEQTGDLLLGQAGVDASDEEVGSGVDGFIIATVARLWRRSTASRISIC